jgi:hypothetical protein
VQGSIHPEFGKKLDTKESYGVRTQDVEGVTETWHALDQFFTWGRPKI